MVLEVIYVTRHGFRSNWVVNHETGEYRASIPGPTGIPSDPALAGYGVLQANQLGDKIVSLDPPVDVIYSSPFYRCLQTLKPTADRLFPQGKAGKKIRVENGLGEFYGLARFDHPSPAPLSELETHFPGQLDADYKYLLVPSVNGESISTLHERIAHTLHRIITALDEDPTGPRSLLICTHAATMICIGRVLTGRMPEDPGEEDFKCFTCSLSTFRRKSRLNPDEDALAPWSSEKPDHVPVAQWNGTGVKGGWECTLNGDCSFLSGGEERGWRFSGDEAFITDPNFYNDTANAACANRDMDHTTTEVEAGQGADKEKGSRL